FPPPASPPSALSPPSLHDALPIFKALDAGWHLAPVWSGDEHNATWVTGNPAHTGVWAEEHSIDSLYQAMRDRSMYTTFDVDASRSEEHTSELQSRFDLVCRLLLEK